MAIDPATAKILAQIAFKAATSWIHDGFHVYCGKAIYSWDNAGLERLGQYIVRAPLSQERMRTGNTLINAKFTYYDSFKIIMLVNLSLNNYHYNVT